MTREMQEEANKLRNNTQESLLVHHQFDTEFDNKLTFSRFVELLAKLLAK